METEVNGRVRELEDFFGGKIQVICQFTYGDLGIGLSVSATEGERGYSYSIGQNPALVVGIYEALIREGWYMPSPEVIRDDYRKLLALALDKSDVLPALMRMPLRPKARYAVKSVALALNGIATTV